MKKIVIDLQPKLPGNETAMRERVAQITEGIRILQNQLKLLLGSGLSLGPVPTFTCKRCGNAWQKKRFQYNKPRRCPECKSPYWDRERTFEKITRKRVQQPVSEKQFQEYLDATYPAIAPPPVAPMSLRERLAAATEHMKQLERNPYNNSVVLEQQPAAETDVMPHVEPVLETVPVTGEESATDSPEQKSVVESEYICSSCGTRPMKEKEGICDFCAWMQSEEVSAT